MYADKPKVLIVDDGGRRTSHKASIAMAMACLNMAVCNDSEVDDHQVMEITLRPGADLNELKVPAAMQKPTNGKRPNKDRYGSPYGVNSRQQR